MNRKQTIKRRYILPVLLALCATSPAPAQSFYEGKTITVVTSTGVGGVYDLTARVLARHMGRHIPGNPSLIVQNMPGGGNVLATNYIYNIAPKDGLTIASIHNSMPLYQVLDGRGVRFDAGKFNWLGSTGSENGSSWCGTRPGSGASRTPWSARSCSAPPARAPGSPSSRPP